MLKSIAAALILVLQLSAVKANDPFPNINLYGVKIKVADMDKAISFYSKILGFDIQSKAHYPGSVVLKNEGIALLLSKTERSKHIDYPNVEQTGIAFQANDLAATVSRLRANGVEFLMESPQKVGVGIATKFRDPFGNVHSLLEQQVVETPVFDEPRIYNVGFYLSDMEAARKFYCEKLGFTVRTEKYYPPALPLGHRDGTFAFMLHKGDNLQSADLNYETDSQTVLVYKTDDLPNAVNHLKRAEIPLLFEHPQDSPEGKLIAFLSPAGLPMEIIERTEPAGHGTGGDQPEASIDDMAWLAGRWLGDGLGGISEEIWSPPSAGEMMGMFRSIKDDKVVFYEFLTIIEQNQSLAMRLKHFTPAFAGWETKEDFLLWPLDGLEENRAKFGPLEIKREKGKLFITLKMKNKEGKSWQEKFHFDLSPHKS